jgi:hypothetical protein
VAPEPFRWTAEALLALQEVSGAFFFFPFFFFASLSSSSLCSLFLSCSFLSLSLSLSTIKKTKGDGGLYRAPVRGHQPVRDPRQARDD